MWSTEVIAAGSSASMVLIWMVYLQLFWLDHRRWNRPFLIIHHATGQSPQARCLFVNMGKEPVHIQCIIANVYRNRHCVTHYLTDYSRFTARDQAVGEKLREGPLQAGAYIVLGTFENIILNREEGEITKDSDDALDIAFLQSIERLEICIAVTHRQGKTPVGARRTFFVEGEDSEIRIRSYSIYTEQLIGRKKRETVRHWVEERLEPRVRGEAHTEHTEQDHEEPET